MSEVEQTIVVVLVVILVGPELDRVNPDAVCSLDTDVIAGTSQDLVDLYTVSLVIEL